MKAPFNRSARDSAGNKGEGQSISSVLARTGPERVLLEALGGSLILQHPGSGLRNRIRVTISPRLCPL